MINYKTITDTGPYTFSPFVLRNQKEWQSKPTATLSNTQKPPGSSPPRPTGKQPPPTFFEPGNRTRWLLLLLPFCIAKYLFKEISPFQLSESQFHKFYLLFFLCSVLTTHLAINAKRRTLTNLLHDTDDSPYYLNTIKEAYNKWTKTTLAPFLCITIGFIRFIQLLFSNQNATLQLAITAGLTAIFLAIFRANNYKHSHKAIYRSEPPDHINNMSTESRNNLIRAGTLGMTFIWYYDNMVAWGFMDPEEEEEEITLTELISNIRTKFKQNESQKTKQL